MKLENRVCIGLVIILCVCFGFSMVTFAESDKGKVAINEVIVNKNEFIAEVQVKCTNADGTARWKRTIGDLRLTELVLASKAIIMKDVVYVSIYGNLYGMKMTTGEDVFKPVKTGVMTQAPVLDRKENIIYCSGYYGPFATAVSTKGKIIWQYKTEKFGLPYKIVKKSKEVWFYSEYDNSRKIVVFNEEGKLLKIIK